APPTIVFAMCQGPAALSVLRRWEASGVRIINTPAAIANTHRARMLAAFERHGIVHPTSVLLHNDGGDEMQPWVDAGALLQRGAVHATEPDDVVHVDGSAAARNALAAMHRRGIATALVQRHVAGDVIKFYAVRGSFFTCVAPRGAEPPSHDRQRTMN